VSTLIVMNRSGVGRLAMFFSRRGGAALIQGVANLSCQVARRVGLLQHRQAFLLRFLKGSDIATVTGGENH